MKSSSEIYVFRLKPHADLKTSILAWAAEHHIKAGIILTCVGSLEHYSLRFANQQQTTQSTGHFEIVSLTGTFTNTKAHLHLCISDTTGSTLGGHLMEGCRIYTTAEIAVAELTELEFDRTLDATYGYDELEVKQRGKLES